MKRIFNANNYIKILLFIRSSISINNLQRTYFPCSFTDIIIFELFKNEMILQ